jgi:hypothetical protein
MSVILSLALDLTLGDGGGFHQSMAAKLIVKSYSTV